ncbi:DEAD/DEAH box helicase [Klebsiella pneumoniae]|uniref:DEAD/DEAH box helicase n=1 Tax=Klebsiella pneumoniae TaxID=573 RepID=UPI0010F64561|nr:ATP-binding protein [Klebsiella pneumoniae]
MKDPLIKTAINTENVFRFWRAIEALAPQNIDKANERDMLNPVYKTGAGGMLPWDAPQHRRKTPEPGKSWRYSAQAGVYHLNVITSMLEDKIGAHEEIAEKRINGKSRLFDIGFNESGIPQPVTFMSSLSAWSAAQILRHKRGVYALHEPLSSDLSGLPAPNDSLPVIESGFSDFDRLTLHLMQWVENEAYRLQDEELTADTSWLKTLEKLVVEKLCFPEEALDTDIVSMVKCSMVNKPKNIREDAPEKEQKKKESAPDDLINSFFITELQKLDVTWRQGGGGAGFKDFIMGISRANPQRLDIRSEEGLDFAFEKLLPTQPPAGSWPSQYPLAFSQQLAVNEIWNRHINEPGIFAVNGPPGTGKTTLLRDVVAAVVTDRAGKLVKLGGRAFKAKETFTFDNRQIPFYSLHSDLTGSAIVIASANNGAVENISLELPGVEAVPGDVSERSDYFSELAGIILGKPAWGLLAAKMGRKTNREAFVNTLWWGRQTKREDKDKVPPETFSPGQGEGLKEHLSLLRQGGKGRKPVLTWAEAVSRFKRAQAAEETERQQLVHSSGLTHEMAWLEEQREVWEERKQTATLQIEECQLAIQALSDELAAMEMTVTLSSGERADLDQRIHQHEKNKPGLLANLFSFGQVSRAWWERYQRLTDESDALRATLTQHRQEQQLAQSEKNNADNTLRSLERELAQAISNGRAVCKDQEQNHALQKQARDELGASWPERDATDEQRELSAPWLHERWRKAREDVFVAALDVHRAFIENNPVKIAANIGLAMDWLKGRALTEEQAGLALDSLCLVVPVISSTFASMPRMFRDTGQEAIGWLLIDEAGQAQPQHAVGAVWRAKRTVVVGDPKQLDPVSSIPSTVERALAKHFKVPSCWWPGKVSVQILADQTMDVGTYLPDIESEQIWVGCPLRVHRRCDEPMFSISNDIAYDGLMVHGKKTSQMNLPESGWLDVKGRTCEGNWVKEEGAAVEKLLLDLRHQYSLTADNVFLISPFRDCAKRLADIAKKLQFSRDKTGTVHKTQGKEATVVILVLGGNIQNPGAKSWAAGTPNLLNVAVSRAKQRIYVIGERGLWEKLPYFSTLSRALGDLKEPLIVNNTPVSYLEEYLTTEWR